MDNFYGTIDLLKLVGAQFVSVGGENGIFIPTDRNDIFVSAPKEDGRPAGARLSLRYWETHEKYKESCRQNNTDKPDYIAPSHNVQVNYSEEYMKRCQKSAEAHVRADANFMATSPSNDTIEKEARIRILNRARLGNITPMRKAAPKQFEGTAPTATAAQWTPPVTPAAMDDDLPF